MDKTVDPTAFSMLRQKLIFFVNLRNSIWNSNLTYTSPMQGHSWVCEWNLHRTEKIVTNRQTFTANASNLYSYFYYVHWRHTWNRISIGIVILILEIYLTNQELVSIYKAIKSDCLEDFKKRVLEDTKWSEEIYQEKTKILFYKVKESTYEEVENDLKKLVEIIRYSRNY